MKTESGTYFHYQIRFVVFNVTQLTQASILQKKSNVANFFYIFNAEVAQCRQKLEVILGTKGCSILKLSKNVFYKKCGPKLIFFNENFFRKI